MKSPRLTLRDVERDWPASGIAVAESTSIGVTVTSDRNPNRFAALEQTKRGLNGDRIFGIGVILRCDPVLAAPLRSLNGVGSSRCPSTLSAARLPMNPIKEAHRADIRGGSGELLGGSGHPVKSVSRSLNTDDRHRSGGAGRAYRGGAIAQLGDAALAATGAKA
jgi:hypothetical protein